MFWNAFSNYNILIVDPVEFEYDQLIKNSYGITDIIKIPSGYGSEPSGDEYRDGLNRVLDLIGLHKPKVICFIYKKVFNTTIPNSFFSEVGI